MDPSRGAQDKGVADTLSYRKGGWGAPPEDPPASRAMASHTHFFISRSLPRSVSLTFTPCSAPAGTCTTRATSTTTASHHRSGAPAGSCSLLPSQAHQQPASAAPPEGGRAAGGWRQQSIVCAHQLLTSAVPSEGTYTDGRHQLQCRMRADGWLAAAELHEGGRMAGSCGAIMGTAIAGDGSAESQLAAAAELSEGD